ncbi:3-hydroxyacyl-CoA dehydrogenase family protein [Rhodococcus sp. BP-252]|uniref:3-hydroxyacyl-CoA dehydrogenase family protein n=1 Tax=unclassified Rhodococcus (in: high G+C Gram-positive bacteria) TaxID=192944 RepID=UPI001C9ADCC7|nr:MULTISPECIES: 3-hydroxyacyl-CoA dehydrogenase family protein [unclassified Rhodococcus (in: high G+C Gram-positive bacteria)]MBY6412834.1 3-hydroxyacyl-CoA dehydrogenase family protein [Rhodococcus sp. BP-320]MBY6417629.1 3-hydroxyacyl-CoA dehydrogenase family protein [Rhodococcus sp. BP-321]MBY6423481.1 3-hydroxyacyl-CoA dehydrogenase family protein [Rhodococcus sp. BP-324]MBY6427653.1 3-hydroxyacyl-CoA dehydrogenase family protein [Rhodococcus sp. BP-323]MBY6432817.1 3-hydroxyacyl-CoA deh
MTVPQSVGVVGGGRMGAGIAQVFAALGSSVTIAESADQDAALNRVFSGLERAHERGKLSTDPGEILARVSTVAGPADLPPALDLVVEAVPEIPSLKVDVLALIDKTVSGDTVIASNTSSISIAELGAALADPSRFIGMHFFNPVPASTLVEIVRAPATSTVVVEQVRGWVSLLGKTEVLVNDSPGFATSRLGVCLGLEAIRMLEEGVADADSIDRAMELGYKHPMGPLRSTDLVGLDVRLAIAEHLASTLGDRFAPPQLLRDKVARGELGRKSGRGFHDWEVR